jgi:ribosomal-protein-serine acetyltransferase
MVVARRVHTSGAFRATLAEIMVEGALFDDVALRRFQPRDADELYELVERNRVYLSRWLPWAAGETRAHAAQFIASTQRQVAADDGIHTAIFVGDELAGSIGVHGISWANRSTSIGYWLAEAHQGRGIMTRAVAAYLDHSFRTWGLHRFELKAAVDNARSRSVAERLGFKLEGVLRDAERVGEHSHDLAVYSMLAPEWRTGWPRNTRPRQRQTAR